MKHLIILLTSLLSESASSFVLTIAPTASLAQTQTAIQSANDDAHMEVMPRIWDELRKTEKDIVIQQQAGDISETEATKALAERLLETALDYVRTKEHIEEDLASAAHKTFEHALANERVLKDFIVEEELSDIPLDNYLDERFRHEQETEKQAYKEEFEHLNNWAELRMEEEAIKTAIKELKELNEKHG